MSRPEVPRGVLAYLTVSDAGRAIEFYRHAFSATELYRQESDDGRLLHCELEINGGRLMLSDDFPEMTGSANTPEHFGGSPVTLHVQVEDADAVIDRAVAAGATVEMPAADMFWGDRYGRIRDPFGHAWSVGSSAD